MAEICWWSRATFNEEIDDEDENWQQQQYEAEEESGDDDDDDDYDGETDLICGFENSDASDYDGEDDDTDDPMAGQSRAPPAKKKRA